MKSPFPGMDPFIEGCGLWEDFHDDLIHGIKAGLNHQLPKGYVARTSERAYVVLASDDGAEESHRFKPDVAVTTARQGETAATAVAVESVAEVDPVIMYALMSEEFRETFVEVREVGSEKLVTCIEVLSPSNKKPNSEGWGLYLRKRQALFLGRSANLVEIDLLRGGQRMPMAETWPSSPYTILINRIHHAPLRCEVVPAHSTIRLSPLPIPLLKSDPDVVLDLQSMVDAVYEEALYDLSIDYTKPLTPPLSAEEAAWLSAQLKSRETPA